jgi:hypothetical protein
VAVGAALAQFGAQGQQHIKHHAHAGQIFRCKGAVRLVGVHDTRRIRQGVTGQVVIGDQYGNAERVGRCHAFHRSDAVVHGHQQVGLPPGGKLDDVGRQAVAVFKPVGHDEIDVCAEHAQAAYAHCAGGGAVGIVVGNDEQALAIADGIRQYFGSLFDVQQTRRRQ